MKGSVAIEGKHIRDIQLIRETETQHPGLTEEFPLILPGLIDSHVHVESSMVMPSRFEQAAVRFGTVGTVSDPHEIANVLGLEGIRVMLEDAAAGLNLVKLTAPSCVPATFLEESGAVLTAADLEVLFRENRVVALGEMMNFPGVIGADSSVSDKINLARKYGKSVDGHAPGLTGKSLEAYISAGIHTDHECFTIREAEEKIALGMKILIREGSAARNFEALWPLIDRFPDSVMLCTDDFHPDDLAEGHIDRLIRMGLAKGLDFFNLYKAACMNPIAHYGLETGLLRKGDRADFIEVTDLENFKVSATWLAGQCVFGEEALPRELPEIKAANAFVAAPVKADDLKIPGESGLYRIIQAYDGELITGAETEEMVACQGIIKPDIERDILKIVVVNRYRNAPPAIGLIRGFGLKAGAIASSIAHDSHNLVAVGVDDESLADAINMVIAGKGGISAVGKGFRENLPLPVAGLMSLLSVEETGRLYRQMTELARNSGSSLKAPFMTLAFMSLLVIPHLKLGDKGLFDGDTFSFIPLKAD